MTFPADLKYTSDHEWVRIDQDIVTVGITSYAAELLGDVVYIEIPPPGTRVAKDSPCGEIESTKAVSDIFSPVDGVIVEVNELATTDPSIVNRDPYDQGWLYRATLESITSLLSPSQYAALTGDPA